NAGHNAGHEAGHDEIAHVMSPQMLLGVFGALILLTGLTVGVTAVDLGAAGNLIVAMAIATVKAGLVAAFFMHLLYDKKLNLLIFLGSFAFLFLFITFTLMDSAETQRDIEARVNAQAAAANEPG
ncbi:MAG: cytochrome C oxidase subunit IV family protein, partial [Myxococcota bacterium]